MFPDSPSINDQPIIGSASQPILTGSFLSKDLKTLKTSYIIDSYVQFLESAGARVVPLIYDGVLEEELAKLDKLNRVLLPGGNADGADYCSFVSAILEKAKDMNDKGIYFPVWAICLGFE
jgi:gamma-glutamyl hydrolase